MGRLCGRGLDGLGPICQYSRAEGQLVPDVEAQMTSRNDYIAQADQAEINAKHAFEAARCVENQSDRDYALNVARREQQRAWSLRKRAWVS